MLDTLANILKTIAPTLATAVVGPMGGLVVSKIAKELGVEDTLESVTETLKNSTEARLKVKDLELKELELANQNTDSARKMNSEIQSSEHASFLAKNTAYLIDIGVVSATLFLSWFAFIKGVPVENKELVYMALGSLITLCGTVVNFHRGSSQGSKDRANEIKKLNEIIK